MSDMKFTPGPWHYHIGGTGDYPTWGIRIGRGLVHLPGIEPMEVMDANARLIAAAPDLFVALQAAAEYLDGIPESAAGGDDDAVRIARNAFAALVKARGEA